MRYHDTSFFCDKNNPPIVSVRLDDENPWPITVRINQSGVVHDHPTITLFIEAEADFIHFKNSVIQAYEFYRRSKNV